MILFIWLVVLHKRPAGLAYPKSFGKAASVFHQPVLDFLDIIGTNFNVIPRGISALGHVGCCFDVVACPFMQDIVIQIIRPTGIEYKAIGVYCNPVQVGRIIMVK